MDAIVQWIINNPVLAAIVLDALAGAIPDKYISWVGGVRGVVNELYKIINK
jgi:hypothetical protein